MCYNMLMDLKHEHAGSAVAPLSEWDSLGLNSEFNNGYAEDLETIKQQAYAIVDNYYLNRLGAIFYKDDIVRVADTNDIKAYKPSDFLMYFISDREQNAVIEALANNRPINSHYIEKIRKGLVELIIHTGIFEELQNDPFLRASFVKQALSPQSTPTTNGEQKLRRLIWEIDTDFGKSDEAKELFSNPDYLENQYGISEIAKRDSKDTGQDEGKLRALYLQNIPKLLVRIAGDGLVSGKQLVDDPFLRKIHFRAKYALQTYKIGIHAKAPSIGEYPKEAISEEFELSPERAGDLAKIWELDKDFLKSIQYKELLYHYAQDNPEIYSEADEAVIDFEISEIMRQIDRREIAKVIKTYERGNKEGDAAVMALLVPLLGLSNNPPGLKYSATLREGLFGYYSRRKHMICVSDKEKQNKTTKIPIAKTLTGLLRPRTLNKATLERIKTIAHELRHAYQWAGEGVPNKRQDEYRKNLVYYFDSPGNLYKDYRRQLVELDAWKFEERFVRKISKVYAKKKGGSTIREKRRTRDE